VVNASLNWASIVGIVLAVCGGGLYFLRSFKPALARDYDVFFAAIGLLCGGILFFQGWRLDPILQFGQFLLAGTTVFFAYESVRLRGIATDQARRSAFFDDNDQIPSGPRNSRTRWDDDYDQFDQPERISRRFKSMEDNIDDDDFQNDRFRSRRVSRAIPEEAISRRRTSSREESIKNASGEQNLRRRFKDERDSESVRNSFGDRRATRSDAKRGSRPLANKNTSRKIEVNSNDEDGSKSFSNKRVRTSIRTQVSNNNIEDASFTNKNSQRNRQNQIRRSSNSINSNTKNRSGRYSVGSNKDKPRDNSSRFDD